MIEFIDLLLNDELFDFLTRANLNAAMYIQANLELSPHSCFKESEAALQGCS